MNAKYDMIRIEEELIFKSNTFKINDILEIHYNGGQTLRGIVANISSKTHIKLITVNSEVAISAHEMYHAIHHVYRFPEGSTAKTLYVNPKELLGVNNVMPNIIKVGLHVDIESKRTNGEGFDIKGVITNVTPDSFKVIGYSPDLTMPIDLTVTIQDIIDGVRVSYFSL